MPGYFTESGVASGGVDLSELPHLNLVTREATRADVGAMAHIFIQCFRNDSTARLLYQSDSIWPVVVEMLRYYLYDDHTYVILAEEMSTGQIVGWTSVSIVIPGGDDHFKYCDSTVWAGRQLLGRETRARGRHAPVSMDEMKRSGLISKLREHNRNGQNRHAAGQRLVINTVALHPDVVPNEIPEVAGSLFSYVKDIARGDPLPIWMQLPEYLSNKIWEVFVDLHFDEVGFCDLNLARYATEEHWSQRQWGFERWTQWVLPARDL